MKKGINSMDAFLAITVMLFIAFWLQNFFNLNFSNSQDYGVQAQLKAEAARVGTIMNSFFATNPSAQDYIIVSSSIMAFTENLSVVIAKSPLAANVMLTTEFNGINYSSSYPVAKKLSYDGVTQKVTA
jgi:hypothetical protein